VNEQELAHRAEQALLGGLLAGGDPGIVAQVRAGDFSDPRHQAIYLAIVGTTEPADGQVGGPRGRRGRAARQQARDMTPYLDQLAAVCPAREHLASYAAMIRQVRAARGATGQPGRGRQRESADDQLASAGAWLSANGARGRRAAGPPAAAAGTDPLQNPGAAGLARALRPVVHAQAEAARTALEARQADTPSGSQAKGAQPGINRESLQRMVLADLMRHPADGRAAVARIPADMFTAGPLRQLYEMISARIAAGQPVDPLIIAWDARQHDEAAATATGRAARWTLSAIALRIGSTPTARGTTRVLGRALLADHLLTVRFGSRWTQNPEVAARLGAPGPAGRAEGTDAAVGHGSGAEHQAARETAPAGPSSDPARGPVARATSGSATGHPVGRGRERSASGPAERGNGAAPSQ
jgi:hypothetical protein